MLVRNSCPREWDLSKIENREKPQPYSLNPQSDFMVIEIENEWKLEDKN